MNRRSKRSTRDGEQGTSGVSKTNLKSEEDAETDWCPKTEAQYGQVSTFESLPPPELERCLSYRDYFRRSLLHIAAIHERIDMVEFFHSRSSENLIDSHDYRGVAPIHTLVVGGRLRMVTELLRIGADIASMTSKKGNTPLHCAALSPRDLEIAEALIDRGADVNFRNKILCTPLHYAASNGGVEVCKFLIEKGAEIDVEDQAGQTPLTHAVIEQNKEVVRYLLDCGADRKLKTEYKVLNRYPEDYLEQDPLMVQKTRKPIKEFFNKQPVQLSGVGQSYSYFYPPQRRIKIKPVHPKTNHKADDETILGCANAALSWYNRKHRNAKVKGREYKLVKAVGGTVLPSLCHCNFIARPKDRREAKGFLFFAEVKITNRRKICHVCSIIRKVEKKRGLHGCKICERSKIMLQHPRQKNRFTNHPPN